MKVAIVHDWLVIYAGAEKVLEQMIECFPDADLFSLIDFLPDDYRSFIKEKSVTTSFLQKLPFAKTRYRSYLQLMPFAIEQFDLSGYDLVISSSHAVAKGVITGPDQLHICMCYSPIRYAWDLQHQYLKEADLTKGLRGLYAKRVLHRIRQWDIRTVNNVDHYISISNFIARRIWKLYRRQSEVIYPPVDVEIFALCNNKNDFYLTASRMVPYKKIDLIVKAFSSMPNRRLVVVGTGPDFEKVKDVAGKNVLLLGYQPTKVLKKYMQRAAAFIFIAEEDFGIIPIEAQACGTPVIAYGKGGILETVIEGETGLFFQEQNVDALIDAVDRFDEMSDQFDPAKIRENSLRFSIDRFRKEFSSFVSRKWKEFTKRTNQSIN